MRPLLWMILCSPSVWLMGADITITVKRAGDGAPNTAGYYEHTTEGTDLRGALNFANQQNIFPEQVIIGFNLVSPEIILQAPLPVIHPYYEAKMTLDWSNAGGSDIIINGDGDYRGLFAYQGIVIIQNLTIQN